MSQTDYAQYVWGKQALPDLAAVQQHSPGFFAAYRQSAHHSALRGRCPADMHPRTPARRLAPTFALPARVPLYAGAVHFICCVSAEQQVRLLNLAWAVPRAQPDQGVWVTLQFRPQGARLRVYDAAPMCMGGVVWASMHSRCVSPCIQRLARPTSPVEAPYDPSCKGSPSGRWTAWYGCFLRCLEVWFGC